MIISVPGCGAVWRRYLVRRMSEEYERDRWTSRSWWSSGRPAASVGRPRSPSPVARGAGGMRAARGIAALHALTGEIAGEVGTGRALAVPTDIANPEGARALAASAERTFGRVDTWVNAAAVSVWGRVEEITDAEFEQVLRINVLGQIYGAKAALPALRRAGGGVLIGISSRDAAAQRLCGQQVGGARLLRQPAGGTRPGRHSDRDHHRAAPSVDTPFSAHARSRIGGRPKPPPPVYAPEVVADAIVRAAVRPSREVLVGGAAMAASLSVRLSPALSDAAALAAPDRRRIAAGGAPGRAVRHRRPARPRPGTDRRRLSGQGAAPQPPHLAARRAPPPRRAADNRRRPPPSRAALTIIGHIVIAKRVMSRTVHPPDVSPGDVWGSASLAPVPASRHRRRSGRTTGEEGRGTAARSSPRRDSEDLKCRRTPSCS